MKTLKDYKQEAREEFTKLFNSAGFDHVPACGCFGECECKSPREKLESFLEETLDQLVGEIEKAVRLPIPPEYADILESKKGTYKDGYFARDFQVDSAFTRLKGENVAEGECSCEEPHVSKRVVHVRKGEGNCHIV